MNRTVWVLESEVFPNTHANLRAALQECSLKIVDWSDDWWSIGTPDFGSSPVVFHGSLGNASLVDQRLDWKPGAFCPVDRFHCSSWYPAAAPWLLHKSWRILPANEFVANALMIAGELGGGSKVFVRPDSPLKPFSGRVVDVATVTLSQLDHGFYYDDESLPIVVAPLRQVDREWRFVVAQGCIVGGSSYDANTRRSRSESMNCSAAEFATHVCGNLVSPADIYVLDVCESDGAFHLLELNPFGGADLYATEPDAIIRAVDNVVAKLF